ncbi:hypothetical protein [Mycobacteroides salmoniphilum]|uniref:hypothetical protein n=1 Tax=Mycobacteroides salmoniphilum TaxID=404941 RepID=UPI0012FF86F3|nr:hypothetical protein [Mycobacteroides salmoniphilum]
MSLTLVSSEARGIPAREALIDSLNRFVTAGSPPDSVGIETFCPCGVPGVAVSDGMYPCVGEARAPVGAGLIQCGDDPEVTDAVGEAADGDTEPEDAAGLEL